MEGINLVQMWSVVAIFLFVFEIATQGLTTIWFACGALVSAILAYFGLHVVVQVIAFVGVSIVLLMKTRAVLVDRLKLGKEKTNTDALVGEHGVVEETIQPLTVGRVKLNGMSWSALASGEYEICKGQEVRVVRIEGVKLIVEAVEK